MRRVVSVWFPHWPTDRLRRRRATAELPPEAAPHPHPHPHPLAGAPLVTAFHDGRRRVLAATDPAAAALGLRPGMAVAQALALVPGLDVAEAEPDADADALRRLARWCHAITPLAAPCPPDGLWLDISGCAHLAGGEAALLGRLLARLARDGLHARAAAADTPGAAHALARHGAAPAAPPGSVAIVTQPGGHAEAIAPLPVAALRISPELDTTLRRLGFEQIGHLARIPRALLARRFGPLPGMRLDQAHGRIYEPIVPLAHETPLQRRLAFMEPLLTAEAFRTVIDRLVEPLCAEMERQGLGARQLDLLFERVDGHVAAIRVGTARASRDAGHLAHMLAERLETIDPGLGVEAMRLIVPLAEPLRWEQQQEGGGPYPVARLVDRLANRLGGDAVYRATPVETDLPERQVKIGPAAELPGMLPGVSPVRHPGQADGCMPPSMPAVAKWMPAAAAPMAAPPKDAATRLHLRAERLRANHLRPTHLHPKAHMGRRHPLHSLSLGEGGVKGLPHAPNGPSDIEKKGRDKRGGSAHSPLSLGSGPSAPTLLTPGSESPPPAPMRLRHDLDPGHSHPVHLRLVPSSAPPATDERVSAPASPSLESDPPLFDWRPRHEPKPLAKPAWPTWPNRLQAPARLLTPPHPVKALAALPDAPPTAFVWRRRHRIRRAEGPERIFGEWWRNDAPSSAVRDYFIVEDEEGQRFWLFRRGNGIEPATGDLAWFLHGLF